jgi:hypothetical protein
MLFYLLCGHMLMDYALQGDAMAREKSYKSETPLQKSVPWYHWLTAHAVLHGLAVAVVTESVLLGVVETVVHWFIDLAKCAGITNLLIDQMLHIACKVLWWAIVTQRISHGFDLKMWN